MKTIATLMLFCASLYATDPSTEETSDITSKVLEQDFDRGATHVRLETFYRGKRPILRILQTTRAGVTKTSRSYDVGGDLVMVESDEDGDGTFETLCVFNANKKEIEVFRKNPDGSVKPADAKTLAAWKDQFIELKQFWCETLGARAAPDKVLESGKTLNKKFRDLEKQKTKATNDSER